MSRGQVPASSSLHFIRYPYISVHQHSKKERKRKKKEEEKVMAVKRSNVSVLRNRLGQYLVGLNVRKTQHLEA
jgi:hypothetical protein